MARFHLIPCSAFVPRRHSNLVLTQGEENIEACAHQFGAQQSSMRQLQPGKR